MKTGIRNNARWATIVVFAVFALFVAGGCGGNNQPSGAKTGPGAKAGVPGNEAGGVTVEAGKVRSPQEIAQEKKHFSQEPPPVQILTGNTTGYLVNKPTVAIAQTTPEFRAMMKRHFSNGVKKQQVAPIDFKTRQAVGLFLPKSPKGSELAITDVHQEGDTVVVSAAKLLAGKNCKFPPGKPRLFHVVETRKMDGAPKVKIKIKTQKTTPCS